jgi:nucleoid-associated protein YgaU
VQPVVAGGRGSLRVVTGETLESIARRVYGDPQMATRLFAANRDRLRSPELLVPGMELRLP